MHLLFTCLKKTTGNPKESVKHANISAVQSLELFLCSSGSGTSAGKLARSEVTVLCLLLFHKLSLVTWNKLQNTFIRLVTV